MESKTNISNILLYVGISYLHQGRPENTLQHASTEWTDAILFHQQNWLV